MERNKIIKLGAIVGILFLIICFYNPIFIDLSREKYNMTIKGKLNTKRIVLSSLFNIKANSKLSVYIIWDSYELKNLPKEIPHYKILYTENDNAIKEILQLPFLYTGGDMSTLSSKLVIIQDGYKLYESQITLSNNDIGLQNNITGWIVPINKKDLISVISKFNKYKYPILIVK
ncbi:hypothetical protein HUK48_10310 [Prevotella corporis]|uniref:Uncharacterized protein n=1 Tax=Prevotella corporis TaxID=28128 RepID=A0A133Q5U4_9BACT|nr:hypothetical protein [Prevotella corporis]KXA38256.1 hypothetical protein HMPREF3226_01667 [Prevotella corporis]MDQ7737757.1 hypothetical protein [Prevotella corporis]